MTFSPVALATINAASRDCAVAKLCERAAQIWGIPADAVVVGERRSPSRRAANAGEFDPPLSLKPILAGQGRHSTGGPIAGHSESQRRWRGPELCHPCRGCRSRPETGVQKVLRYLVVQDAGKAVHPAYVEGQFQGGAVQGIGWVLNEEYIYGEDGRLQNAGFLDYRIPVCSDVPMIDTVIVEVPNPGHPYGVRGVGETSIVPPLAAVANAVSAAIGVRATTLPMSPPRILEALKSKSA